MKWIKQPASRDEPLRHAIGRGSHEQEENGYFNGPLPENDGGVCVLSGFDADEDIREKNTKSFQSTEDMLKSLKQPW